jgi:predicted metal-dependent HD superfamily phosphohydrolase
MNDMMFREWIDLLQSCAVDSTLARETFADVAKHYAEPGRHYHSLDHIQNVLATVDSLASHAQNLNAVKLASWLHDVIYDSKAADNEERSAEYAERLCQTLSIPDGSVVAALIRKTKTHDADGNADAQVLLDADLAILGASAAVYRTYAEQIRREYDWVPDPEYREGRRQILATFLARPTIFHFLIHLEVAAHRNIAAEIALLA